MNHEATSPTEEGDGAALREPDPAEIAASGAVCCEQDQRARQRLLRAAADVFDRKGYAAASVREIVEQAGITKPVLYYHYGSKEGILIAILEEGARTFEASFARVMARDGTSRERLVAVAEEISALFRQHLPVVRVAHAIYFGPREAAPKFDFGKYHAVIIGSVRRIVEEGVTAGELPASRADEALILFNGLISLFADLELNPGALPTKPDTVRRVIDLIFEGLIPRRDGKEN